ncbi:hypothetical protein [uncultured Maribacter sp.]|uniref:hypothetical protein n=1 Tax=uncultured Maribacter sp. TaxID=431308 RepID=UPI00262E27CE|nr:hypothetical protein [uncultured Maribacter sp.]
MIKKIVIAIVCIVSFNMYAQEGSVSPYSYFGIGDLRTKSTVENQMMGGIGMYADSIHVNLKNPASYGKLGLSGNDKVGMTVYTAGVSRREVTLSSFTAQEKTSITTLDYLGLGFSLGKGLGIGFGLMPYSSVGYNLVGETTNSSNALVTNTYTGDGGLNKVYFSVGYELRKDLSVGLSANYNFGKINNNRVQAVENVLFGTFDRRTSKIDGVDFNFAVNYTPAISKTHTLFTSVRVNAQGNLKSINTQNIGSYSLSNGNDIETISVDLASNGLSNTELKIPATTTLGLGYGKNKQWFLGAEYSLQSLGSFTNDFLGATNVVYTDASTFAFGGFYVPDYDSFTSYLKRVTYRAGLRMDKTGMMVNNKEVNDFGITFGLGLPLGRSFSNINLGFELGKKGTTSADLIEEKYFKINIGLSLNDMWFQKRKIN